MTSWLDSFTSTVAPTSQASSLDSRLLNFMQNLPGTPSKSETPATKSIAITPEPKMVITSGDSGGGTPVKDEHSGQGTPVQDEDMQTNPQNVLSKLISMAKNSKDSSEHPLKKFSPIGNFDEEALEKVRYNKDPKEEQKVYDKNSSSDIFSSLMDKDWRIVPGATHMEFDKTFTSKGTCRNGKDGENSANESSRDNSKPYSLLYARAESKRFSPIYQTSDSTYSDNINIIGTPPWNTSGSYQTAEGFKKLTEEDVVADDKDEHFTKPLQPPPKPSFSNFDIFNSPLFSSPGTAKDREAQSNSHVSSVQSAIKSRQDPRLNSQNYALAPKGTSHEGRAHERQEGDDIEPMDMDLEDSDNEQEDSENVKTCNKNHSANAVKSKEESSVLVRPSVSDTSEIHRQSMEDVISQPQRPSDRYSFIEDGCHEDTGPSVILKSQSNYLEDARMDSLKSESHSDYSAEMDVDMKKSTSELDSATETGLTPRSSSSQADFSDADPLTDAGTTTRSNNQQDYVRSASIGHSKSENEMNYLSEEPNSKPGSQTRTPYDYSPDKLRDEFSPETNFTSPPYHERRPPPPGMKPMTHNRDFFPSVPAVHSFPLGKEDPWRTGSWPRPPPPREPPWHGQRPRYEDNGYPSDSYGYDRRGGGPGFDFYGPAPRKRFPPPPHYFGRERRGFFAPRHH